MSKNLAIANLLKLSVPERILIVEDIWDSIAVIPKAVQLTEAQKTELNRRLEAYHQDPSLGSPWEDVKLRISS